MLIQTFCWHQIKRSLYCIGTFVYGVNKRFESTWRVTLYNVHLILSHSLSGAAVRSAWCPGARTACGTPGPASTRTGRWPVPRSSPSPARTPSSPPSSSAGNSGGSPSSSTSSSQSTRWVSCNLQGGPSGCTDWGYETSSRHFAAMFGIAISKGTKTRAKK